MPKPIQLTILAEEFALGKIFRTLDGMEGVASISLHGTGPSRLGGEGKVKQRGSFTTSCIILKVLTTSNAGRELLRSAIVSGGKSPSSLQSAIDFLRKEKHIRDMPKGKFQITAAGRKHYASACKIKEGE
jgi:hypothetical protein